MDATPLLSPLGLDSSNTGCRLVIRKNVQPESKLHCERILAGNGP